MFIYLIIVFQILDFIKEGSTTQYTTTYVSLESRKQVAEVGMIGAEREHFPLYQSALYVVVF